MGTSKPIHILKVERLVTDSVMVDMCAHSIFGGVCTWITIAYKAEHAAIVILEIEQMKLCKHYNSKKRLVFDCPSEHCMGLFFLSHIPKKKQSAAVWTFSDQRALLW